MNSILRKLVGMNWLMVALVFGLCVFGVMAIYSATYMREEIYLTEMWRRQIVWLAIGLVVFFVAALIDYRAWLNHVSFPLIMYLGGLGFLTLTHFIGRTTYGARSWLDIGPISFQPAQLAVISTLLLVAWLLANTENWAGLWPTIGRILSCAAIIAPPWILILIQPDLGECLVWIPAVLAILYVGRVPKRYLLVMIIAGIALIPVVANFGLKPYQRERLTTFLNPDYDPQGAGWTINQSLRKPTWISSASSSRLDSRAAATRRASDLLTWRQRSNGFPQSTPFPRSNRHALSPRIRGAVFAGRRRTRFGPGARQAETPRRADLLGQS
jgi:rod shape determining protein RodA